MKKVWLPRAYAACFGICLALMALHPQIAVDAARKACGLWANKVMPALFPYLVASQLLAASVPGDLFMIPLSMLGGSPSGARLIGLSGVDSQKAQRLSALCTTISPLYVLGALGSDYRLLLSHWLGAFAAWAAVYAWQKGIKAKGGGEPFAESAESPGKTLPSIPQTIADSALAMLSVCGCMVLFSVISALILRVVSLSPPASAALSSVLEMAGGCDGILALGMPADRVAPILCAAISFGGFSIFLQNASFLKQKGVDLRVQFFAKVIHALAAYGICSVFYLS